MRSLKSLNLFTKNVLDNIIELKIKKTKNIYKLKEAQK